MKKKMDKEKYRFDTEGFRLLISSFGVSLKDACEAILPARKPGDSRGQGRTMTAQEWIEFKQKEKENVGKS